jgi:hypothetical protein
MDCRTAQLLLWFPRAELAAEEAAALEAHLEACAVCRAQAEAERRLDAALRRAMTAVPTPPAPPAALWTRLQAQRRAYYRRWQVRLAGLAALLGLTLFLGWWFLLCPAPLHLHDLRTWAGKASADCQRAAVQEWLQQAGGPHLTIPPDFDYELLIDYGTARIRGHTIPYLLFARSQQQKAYWARVYLLDTQQFPIEQLREEAHAQSAADGPPEATVLDGADEQVSYVVIFTGDLQPFRKPAPPVAWEPRRLGETVLARE